MRTRFRKVLLFGTLAGIAGWLLLDTPDKAVGVAGSSSVRAVPDNVQRAGLAEPLQLPERRTLVRPQGELFGAPPAPPQPSVVVAPAPVAPAVPIAPPMPYRFAGRFVMGGEEEILLARGRLAFAVKTGDVVEGTYRVDSIGADSIELVYLPLGLKDRIVVNSPAPALATLLVASAPTASQPAPQVAVSDGRPAQLRWEGPARVQRGAAFSVTLRLSYHEPLRAAPMQLRFEPGVLEALEVKPGKFLGKGDFSYRINPQGSIFVGASAPTSIPGPDAELFVVTFRPVKPGATAELDMTALSLQGAAGRAIAHDRVAAFRTAIQ